MGRDFNAREARLTARMSQARTAVAAGVSEPLVRLYEANPTAVKDRHTRAALDAVYASFAARSSTTSPPSAA